MKKSWIKLLSAVLVFNLMVAPILAENLNSDVERALANDELEVEEIINLDKDEANLDEILNEVIVETEAELAEAEPVTADETPREKVKVSFVAYPNNVQEEYGKAQDAWVSIQGSRASLKTNMRKQKFEVEKGTKLSEVKAVGLSSNAEFRGWFTASNGGELVSPDTVIDSDVTYYAQFNLPKPTMTADSGAYGFFIQNGQKTQSIDFTKSNHGVFSYARVYDSEAPADNDSRLNYNIPKPTVKDGYKLIGYHYDLSQPDFKLEDSTNYLRKTAFDVLFSNPNWKNLARYGLSSRESLKVSYMYESSDLALFFNMKNVPVELQAKDVHLVAADGTVYSGTISLYGEDNYQWLSDKTLPEGEYTIDGLEGSEGFFIENISNGVEVSLTEDGKIKFTITKLPLDAQRQSSYQIDVIPIYTAVPSDDLMNDPLPTEASDIEEDITSTVEDLITVEGTTTETTTERRPTLEEITTEAEETIEQMLTTETKHSVSDTDVTTVLSSSTNVKGSIKKKNNKQSMAKTGESSSRNFVFAIAILLVAITLISVKLRFKRNVR